MTCIEPSVASTEEEYKGKEEEERFCLQEVEAETEDNLCSIPIFHGPKGADQVWIWPHYSGLLRYWVKKK